MTNLGDPITGWDLRFSFGAGQTVSAAVERLRHPVRRGGVGAQRGLERERRHQRHHVVRLQRRVGREQPRADRVHAQRRRVHREPGHPDQLADARRRRPRRRRPRGRRPRRPRRRRPRRPPDRSRATPPQLVADLGKGWNLGNQLEANINGVPSETAWGNPVITGALIDRVKASGFTTIRIPVSYLSKIGSGPSYTVDAAWLDPDQAGGGPGLRPRAARDHQHARRRLQERQRLPGSSATRPGRTRSRPSTRRSGSRWRRRSRATADA